jgi:ubiquilin
MNPQLGSALQNPQMRAMLTNPQMLQQISNPENMQAMMQLQQSMSTLQRNGLMPGMAPMPGFGGMGGFPPMGGGGGNNLGLNFDSLLSNSNPNSANPAGAANPFAFPPAAPVPAPAPVDPSVRYAAQLQQLKDMGFFDEAANLRAIQATHGNVNAAVERLLGGN